MVTLRQGIALYRFEVKSFLQSFFDELIDSKTAANVNVQPFLNLVFSLKKDSALSTPLLRELAVIVKDREIDLQKKDSAAGILIHRVDRYYYRLCRMQEELGRLDFKKAAPGASPEDYVFSQINFSRYREVHEKDFEGFFLEGISDFDEAFFKENFSLAAEDVKLLIQRSYKKTDGQYNILRENSLILSVMRSLETSLESRPLLGAAEIDLELKNLLDFVNGANRSLEKEQRSPGAGFLYSERLYSLLVLSLDNINITHDDGAKTTLFISDEGKLCGTFRPGNKPWTRVLIP